MMNQSGWTAAHPFWTMVHLNDETWNRTYTWNRPLDEYTPATACRILSKKPVLISYAMWNAWSHSDSRTDSATSQSHTLQRILTPSDKYQQTQSTQQTLQSLPLNPEKYSLTETGPSNITNTQKGVPVTEHPAWPTQHQCIWTTNSIPSAIQTHSFWTNTLPLLQQPMFRHFKTCISLGTSTTLFPLVVRMTYLLRQWF